MRAKWPLKFMVGVQPCIFVTLFYFVLVVLYGRITTIPEIHYYKKAESYVDKPFSREPKSILLWNAFFESRNWHLPGSLVNETFFKGLNCPATNCFITSEVNTLSEITEYDAVVFHVAEAFPILNPFPAKRAQNQIYVFAAMESPAHTKHDLSDEINFYNYTMTYRLDSDILWTYGHLQDIETGQLVAPTSYPAWRKIPELLELDTSLDIALAKKTKTAAWFVSHCDVISKRDDLARSLQQYIPVDIYGKCGTFTCPRNSHECDEKLDDEYKFYLSFENSLCTDYVTEKFFKILDRNIVPVVYGGAEYNKFAPPHSYINAEDFKTIKDLADYLKFLDGNLEEYRKYFWWKKFYKRTKISPFCQLCLKLNNPSEREKVQYYNDIQEWWYGHACRMNPHIEF